MRYNAEQILNELGKKFKLFNHDLKVSDFKISDKTYKEYLTQLTIKGVGKRTTREVIEVNEENLEALKTIEGHCLLGCIDSFGDLLNLELSDQTIVEKEKEDTSTSKDIKKEKKEQEKEEEWEDKNLKKFKTEVIRLKGNMKRAGIKEKTQLNPIVQKFSETKLNKTNKELKTHKDIKPNVIKNFNLYLEKLIQKKRDKQEEGA